MGFSVKELRQGAGGVVFRGMGLRVRVLACSIYQSTVKAPVYKKTHLPNPGTHEGVAL